MRRRHLKQAGSRIVLPSTRATMSVSLSALCNNIGTETYLDIGDDMTDDEDSDINHPEETRPLPHVSNKKPH